MSSIGHWMYFFKDWCVKQVIICLQQICWFIERVGIMPVNIQSKGPLREMCCIASHPHIKHLLHLRPEIVYSLHVIFGSAIVLIMTILLTSDALCEQNTHIYHIQALVIQLITCYFKITWTICTIYEYIHYNISYNAIKCH